MKCIITYYISFTNRDFEELLCNKFHCKCNTTTLKIVAKNLLWAGCNDAKTIG